MKKTTFKKMALASAIGSLMVAGAAEAATVSYNTDGTLYGANLRLVDFPVNDATAMQSSNPAHANYKAPSAFLTASGATATPSYGYAQGGGLPATWWAQIGGTDSASVNSADRIAARQQAGLIGGIGADPNTATFPVFDPETGEYVGDDFYKNNQPTALTVAGASYRDTNTNWGHNADFGLITLTQAGDLTISVSGVAAADLLGNGQSGLRAGFSVWEGWDDAGGTRHTTWDENGAPGLHAGAPSPFNPGAASMAQFGEDRPTDGLGTFLGTAYTLTNNGTATLTLTNLAAGDYTIVIGGYTNTGQNGATGPIATGSGGAFKQYQVSLASTAAPVPVPAAAWLFGSALAGLGAVSRRKRKIVA